MDKQDKARFCYRVESQGGGIGEVRIFHNGKLIRSDGYYREVVRQQQPQKTSLASIDSRNLYRELRALVARKGAHLVQW